MQNIVVTDTINMQVLMTKLLICLKVSMWCPMAYPIIHMLFWMKK